MMNAKSKSLATLAAALTLTSGLAFGGSYFNQVSAPYEGQSVYDTAAFSVPAGASVFWESAAWGPDYAYASLGVSAPGVSVSSYVSSTGSGSDLGTQYTNASGTLDATLFATAPNWQCFATTLISVAW